MAEDPKISQRYRELPREEPPRQLDDAILAAARRAVETRPAPLVVPTGRRRWYFPLAAAAIIVLAVAVTVHVEREQPDPEAVVVGAARRGAGSAGASSRRTAARVHARSEAPRMRATARRRAAGRSPESPESSPPLRPSRRPLRLHSRLRSDAVGGIREAPTSRGRRCGRGPRSASGAVSGFATASPEQWLQGIADLKRQGRHDEADKQLAEFRKRYPDYRIPEAILEKFEKR